MIRKISTIINPTKENANDLFLKFYQLFSKKYNNIIIEKDNVSYDCDIIITFGGDGTIVRALRNSIEKPVLGANAGTLGFLTEINEHNLESAIDVIAKGEYIIEECNTLLCNVHSGNNNISNAIAINDIVLSRNTALDMVNFDVLINDCFVKNYNADGFVVSTPIGSSAYALSCGGPLVEPESNIIELTPIAPHTLINRSIVIDNSKTIKIVVKRVRKDNYGKGFALLSIDGEQGIEILENEEIVISNNTRKIKIARLNKSSFIDNLAQKMI